MLAVSLGGTWYWRPRSAMEWELGREAPALCACARRVGNPWQGAGC